MKTFPVEQLTVTNNLNTQVTANNGELQKLFGQLPVGAIVNGEIGQQGNNTNIINTIFGKFTLHPDLLLPKNSQINLQIIENRPQIQLGIRSINNIQLDIREKALPIDNQIASIVKRGTNNHLHNSPNSLSAKRLSETPISFKIGTIINTVILAQTRASKDTLELNPSTPIPLKNQNGPVQEKKGKSFISTQFARLIEKRHISLFDTNKNTAPRNQLDNNTGSKNQIKPTTLKIPIPMKAGTQIGFKIISTDNNKLSSRATLNITRGLISAQVAATTPSGQPILYTPLGVMITDEKLSLLAGQKIKLQIIPNKIRIPTDITPELRVSDYFNFREWTNLEKMIEEIRTTQHSINMESIISKIPKPDNKMTAKMLFFLQALKGASIKNWLGIDNSIFLEKTNPDLFKQLDEDFLILSRNLIEPGTNEWRTTIIPIMNGLGLDHFQFHTQDQSFHKENHADKKGARFIIDLELSHLGRIQIDGLTRKKNKNFDLIIRSERDLGDQIKKKINTIYLNFTKIMTFSGQISFQVSKKFAEINLPHLRDNNFKGITI
ncbi:MAG: hypothetical protein ISQ90_04955 [Rhodospirillales bacterium]|nr:hypothetical protein [Rhodospirillales bacterium]